MDFFDSSHYSINKNLHRLVGTWPFQKPWEKYILRFFIIILNISATIPEMLKIIQVRNDARTFIDTLPIFFTHIIFVAEYLQYIINANQMTELLTTIKEHWEAVTSDRERSIMCKYADFGNSISRFVCVTFSLSVAFYALTPLVPRVLDIWRPLDESRPYIYVYECDYLVDPKEYFEYIYIHHIIIATVGIISIIATDTMYGVYAQHVCGLFSVVKDELNSMTFSNGKSADGSMCDEMQSFKIIVKSIKKHKKALRFCNLFESAHISLTFVLIITDTLTLTMAGLQILVYSYDPLQVIRFSMTYSAHLMHLFYYSWNGQEILNHSVLLHEAAYNAKWYNAVDKTKKIVSIILVCSSRPIILTAGKLFPLTLMSFAAIFKTSVSYFTVLASFQ